MTIKILNLYAGIGGNRALWEGDIQVTAVEMNPQIAAIYQERFPDDMVIVGDAHQYLLDHFKEFDFIWSSIPCQSHSRARFWTSKNKKTKVDPIYPDIRLYEEILFLQHYYDGLWIVENVIPYYKPLITPQEIGRHLFWSNFYLSQYTGNSEKIHSGNRDDWIKETGVDLSKYTLDIRKDQIYRNCVDSKLGKHIYDCAFKYRQGELF